MICNTCESKDFCITYSQIKDVIDRVSRIQCGGDSAKEYVGNLLIVANGYEECEGYV